MISRQTIKGLELTDIYSFYEYLLACHINGNITDAYNYVKQLSKPQRVEFTDFLNVEMRQDYEDHVKRSLSALYRFTIDNLKK